jgi:predicted O-methyltransferase YrrM
MVETLIDELLADPPIVHVEMCNPEGGVWRTDRDCYEFLAKSCGPGSRTLETGLGISTVLFLRLGTQHTCIAPFESEISHLLAYCRDRGIALDRFELLAGRSEQVLPTLKGELDAVFIDGGHGFPIPMIDWYYAGSRLRRGGIVVIDDLEIPAVRLLKRYLDCDPRWVFRSGTPKWAAFERLSEGPLLDEWTQQMFYEP